MDWCTETANASETSSRTADVIIERKELIWGSICIP